MCCKWLGLQLSEKEDSSACSHEINTASGSKPMEKQRLMKCVSDLCGECLSTPTTATGSDDGS